jgi:hypothetical protein
VLDDDIHDLVDKVFPPQRLGELATEPDFIERHHAAPMATTLPLPSSTASVSQCRAQACISWRRFSRAEPRR